MNMSIELNDKEILILYKPDKKKDKNTYNLALQLSAHINDFDIIKDPPTETQLKEIIMLLNVSIQDVIDTESDDYLKKYKNAEMDEAEWIKALVSNPQLIRTPIVFKGKKGMIIDTPSNVLELDPKKGFNSLNE